MEKVKLTEEEKKIWEEMQKEEAKVMIDLEAGHYKTASKETIEAFRTTIKANVEKRKAISIKPLEADIIKIKTKAISKGIPYQTLINSVLHQFANDKLVES